MIDGWSFWVLCEVALRWIWLDLTDDKSTLVQVMAWCCQAPSYYLSQCWPRSMLPYGVIRPNLVNTCTMNILSALWLQMAWCFSTRASVATVLSVPMCFQLIQDPGYHQEHDIHLVYMKYSIAYIDKMPAILLMNFPMHFLELRIELTYHLSKFSFSRNFQVLLSW